MLNLTAFNKKTCDTNDVDVKSQITNPRSTQRLNKICSQSCWEPFRINLKRPTLLHTLRLRYHPFIQAQVARTQDTMATDRLSLESLNYDIINSIVPFIDFRDYHNLLLVSRQLQVRQFWSPETNATIAQSRLHKIR
jgi:hypothetical protein